MNRIVATAAASVALALAGCARDTTGYSGPFEREVREAIPALEASVGLKFKTTP